jgi:hypothetical protein
MSGEAGSKLEASGLETCARCGVLGTDRRTLWMACFYAMNELGIPFEQVGIHGVVLRHEGFEPKTNIPRFSSVPYRDEFEQTAHTRQLFALRVCKGCRGEWMGAIKAWFRGPPGDAARWNDDASTHGADDGLPDLISETERLRAELTSLEQRVAAVRGAALQERARREAEDSTAPSYGK